MFVCVWQCFCSFFSITAYFERIRLKCKTTCYSMKTKTKTEFEKKKNKKQKGEIYFVLWHRRHRLDLLWKWNVHIHSQIRLNERMSECLCVNSVTYEIYERIATEHCILSDRLFELKAIQIQNIVVNRIFPTLSYRSCVIPLS